MDKAQLLRKFSSDPDRYYKVGLFEEHGFTRRSCRICGRFFWAIGPRETCPGDSDDTYSFIGDPPTSKRFDYAEAWRQVEGFFTDNGHASVSRYPVVCRWRDDLYFTIASIVDFQRVMGSKVVFEFPANPLVVPQTCLRFKDLENVGVTGRHFSSFCMVGQHAIADNTGYWKDRCIELDYGLLTRQFGIPGEEVVFVEDVWAGGGSFGSSLEYFVRGVELGNAVFTEFRDGPGGQETLEQRIIDMGAGLERLSWITMGTPTAYDCCFGPITGHLFEKLGIDTDSGALATYYMSVARNLEKHGDLNAVRRIAAREAGLSEHKLEKIIAPLEGAYLIADHLRTLVFAITDGALPSNVGGGYNLRVMLRRVMGVMDRLGARLDIGELVDMHVDYLAGTYGELAGGKNDAKTILDIEGARYIESKTRMEKIAGRMAGRGAAPGVDELITLYESDGITPDYLREAGIISEVPSSFYARLSDLHQSEKRERQVQVPTEGLPETEMLFYMDDPAEFEARVLRVSGDSIILDRTSFYARGGGQEPDHGMIGEARVVDVNKYAGVIVHTVEGNVPIQGETVPCMIDAKRRAGITKNHTSTHILNSSARGVLGSWVWQHSAFKEADHARLDITHHSPLSAEQVRAIENTANDIVAKDIQVDIQNYERGQAEQRYGFRIYQGGVVPVKSVRIVSVGDFDVEACGGTHVDSTGKIGMIRITRTKRIQDGVVRLEFVSGMGAQEYDRRTEAGAQKRLKDAAARRELEEQREQKREHNREIIPALLERIAASSKRETIDGIQVDARGAGPACLADSDSYDERFHIAFGEKLITMNTAAIYCGIFGAGGTVRVIAYAGDGAPAGRDAKTIAGRVSSALGGSCGGNARFAKGGGRDASRRAEAAGEARLLIFGEAKK